MPSPRKLVQGVLEGSAHQLAFRIAQSLERTLVARAVEFAARDSDTPGAVVVTSEYIRRGLDGDLIDEACAKIGVVLDGERKTERSKSALGA